MVTLKEIAEEANVSLMTVSNVLNGKTSRVSKEKAEEIQALLKQKNYMRNPVRRSSGKSKSNVVAIILRSMRNENSLSAPHNAHLIGAIIRHLQDIGYFAMVNLVEDRESLASYMRTWNVQAAIFLGMFDEEIEQIYSMSSIPMVFIDSYSKFRQLSNVGIDDYKGGQLAAEYLLNHQHRDIAFVSPPNYDGGVIQQRLMGFTDALIHHHMEIKNRTHITVLSEADPIQINEAVDQLIQLRGSITAAFVTSDGLAAALMDGLWHHGVRIPQEFSIVGFDDMPIARQTFPPLTTIAQDLNLKARLAVDILTRRLQTRDSSVESRILDVTLIERDSVAFKEGEDIS